MTTITSKRNRQFFKHLALSSFMLIILFFNSNNMCLSVALAQNEASFYFNQAIEYSLEENNTQYADVIVNSYKKAADMGNTQALHNLAYMYRYGEGVKKDIHKAIELYEQALDLGDAESLARLVCIYYFGIGVKKDHNKVAELYTKIINTDNAQLIYKLANMYHYGNGVKEDRQKSAELFKKAAGLYREDANREDADAYRRLAIMYHYGFGVEKDAQESADLYQKAAKLYKETADRGDAQSYRILADMHNFGQGVKRDAQKAAELYQKAAEKGDAEAYRSLANMYNGGRGVKKDVQKAIELFNKAADNGNATAYHQLARLYIEGEGVEKNTPKAIELHKKSFYWGADISYLKSMASMYLRGKGVEKDFVKAADLFTRAAELGDTTTATVGLGATGENYERKKDYNKAAECYIKAIELGGSNLDGLVRLGSIYEKGDSVERNIPKAIELYKKAADNGSKSAQNNLSRLEVEFPQERAKAEEKAFSEEPPKERVKVEEVLGKKEARSFTALMIFCVILLILLLIFKIKQTSFSYKNVSAQQNAPQEDEHRYDKNDSLKNNGEHNNRSKMGESFLARVKDDNIHITVHRVIFLLIYLAFLVFGFLNFTETVFGIIYFIVSALLLPWCFLNISRCYKFLYVFYPVLVAFGVLCYFDPSIPMAIASSAIFIVKTFFFFVGVIVVIVLGYKINGGTGPSIFETSRRESEKNLQIMREELADERRRERERRGGSL